MKTMKPFTPEEFKNYDEEKMGVLADKFADQVPEGKLSPAQIQQYCTENIDEPEAAVDGSLAWIEKDKEETARIA